jgi:hypothetical protein
MNDYILNVVDYLLCYADGVVTDNPHQRAIDNRLRLESVAVKNPYGNAQDLAPGQSFSLFANTIATALSGSSVVSIDPVGPAASVYRLTVNSGPSGFRTGRAVSGITTCTVAINNNALATFDFTGATVSAVQVGDLMRINGLMSYDVGPYAFNPINSGLWKVIGISGTVISCVRPVGTPFAAVAETPATPVTNDVQFFADDIVRPGMMFQITGTFSKVTQGTYQVQASTPTTIDFVSTSPIPQEDSLTFVPGSMIVYTGVKKLVHIEVDQQCAVQFNGATDTTNQITPLDVSSHNCKQMKGFMTKTGEAYSCTVVNMSVNTCRMSFFTVE